MKGVQMSVVEFGVVDTGVDVEVWDRHGGFTLEESTSVLMLQEELESDDVATALIHVADRGVEYTSELSEIDTRMGVACFLLHTLEQHDLTALACFYDIHLYDSVVGG